MIGLSPLSAGHRRRFQPTCVRPSTGSYPRFSLPTDSSPGFASAARDSSRPVKARFRSGSLSVNLAPRQRLAGSFYKRHAVTTERLLRLLVGARFQVLFHSPPGVLFTFPSRYWCAIGHRVVLRLGWWSTQVRTGFHVPGPTQGPRRAVRYWVRVRGCHPLRPALPCRSAPQPGPAPGGGSPRMRGPATPVGANPCRVCPLDGLAIGPLSLAATRGVSSIDFLSSGYLDVSVPRVVLPLAYVIQRGDMQALLPAWVRPFGDPRVEGCVLLAGDYRSLPRPSSAPCAKASAVRPCVSCRTASGPRDIRVSHEI